jgi:dCMP deaminase
MYVHGLPVCSDCAKGIIQVGVKRIVMDGSIPNRWKDSWQLTQKMFNEANVKWELTNVSNPRMD